jgi:plastocyanin
MRHVSALALALVTSAALVACGGTSSPSAPSPSPSTPSPSGGSVVTINLTSNNGAQSFSPNPASIQTGQMVVWHNADTITHRVVLNDGSIDTGDLAPGASSAAKAWTATSAQYHCSLHPTMVGSVNTSTASSPSPSPCDQAGYC